MELDEGRVYGIKSKEGRVELLLMSSNNVCGRIIPTIARLESLKCINLSDNHLSGPIPVELGSLLQLHNLQLQGNNLRGVFVQACFATYVVDTPTSVNGRVCVPGWRRGSQKAHAAVEFGNCWHVQWHDR